MKLKSKFLIVLFALIFILAACNKQEDGEPVLPENMIPIGDFIVVRGDNSSRPELDAAQKFRKAITEAYNIELAITTDWDGSRGNETDNNSRNEVLIGATNREQSVNALAELGANDFAITFDGIKIAITGGSDFALDCAINYFILNYIGGSGVSLENNMQVILSTTEAGFADINAKKIAVFMDGGGPAYSDLVIEKLKSEGYNLNIYDYGAPPSSVFNANTADLAIIC